jgi:hypothetical protein
VLILKRVKVIYFDTLLQVLILTKLLALNYTKIVQNAGSFHESLQTINLGKTGPQKAKNASKDAGAARN